MKDDVAEISKIGQDLANSLKTLTSEINLGFGSFIDKVMLPYTDIHSKKYNKV